MSLRVRLAVAFALIAIATAGVIAIATPFVINRGFSQIDAGTGALASSVPGHGPGAGPGLGQGLGPGGPGLGQGQRLADIRESMIVTIGLVAIGAAILASLLGILAARRLARPIRQLESAAAAVAAGDLEQRSGLADRADELGDLGRSFDGMAAALAHGEAERRQFTQDAVHELRTPITVIEATTSAVLDGVYPHADEHLRTVRDQARLLSRIVDDLRTISLAEGGRLELRREALDSAGVVADVARDFEVRARDAGIAIATEAPAAGVTVLADPDRIRQALAALLDNAIRHTPHGGRITVAAIAVAAGSERRGVRFEVRDSGPGIAPDDLPRVFDRLYQADPARDRRTGSSGLGLAVVRALVEAHRGRVGAGVAPEGGALVWLELPEA